MLYTESHEWIRVENGIGTVGITEHASQELGQVVYVELPKIGHQYKMAEEIAVLESTKAAADVYAPVGGKVLEVNEKLKNHTGMINTSPESDGWLFKMQIDDLSELQTLMDRAEYLELVK